MDISYEMAHTVFVTLPFLEGSRKEGETRFKTTFDWKESTFDYREFMNALHKEVAHYKFNHSIPFTISMSWELLNAITLESPYHHSVPNEPPTVFGIPVEIIREDGLKCIVELEGVK